VCAQGLGVERIYVKDDPSRPASLVENGASEVDDAARIDGKRGTEQTLGERNGDGHPSVRSLLHGGGLTSGQGKPPGRQRRFLLGARLALSAGHDFSGLFLGTLEDLRGPLSRFSHDALGAFTGFQLLASDARPPAAFGLARSRFDKGPRVPEVFRPDHSRSTRACHVSLIASRSTAICKSARAKARARNSRDSELIVRASAEASSDQWLREATALSSGSPSHTLIARYEACQESVSTFLSYAARPCAEEGGRLGSALNFRRAREHIMADTKFAQFIAERKLDGRRIMAASRKIERLLPEDRTIRLRKRQAKKAEEGDTAAKETRKPRTGRPVTPRALAAALSGKAISGPTKTRILRAINRLLEQKKLDPVDLRALF
jgi:hypothetical protein